MITLSTLDYVLIFTFFAITLSIGVYVSKKSGKNSTEFFLSGRTMPWWLLGISMVATTFSTDTPNFVTDIVRKDGVSANWMWWAFLITGLLTVFVYAKLWRKSNVNTDIEFYELRYGGKPAKFLRVFRALYLGLLFNVFAMAGVTLAAIKIGSIMLGLQPWETILYAGSVTVIFSALGGFKGVIYTDFILFFVAMAGAIGAAIYLVNLPEIGGIQALITHENVVNKLSILPDFNNTEAIITLLIIPLAVQWWSSWYPGAEPGGGG
ncbi:MAG: Na+:solute symporter, partial [Polaribacter sp.]|nr:Na+:solute symporter [Polaribacter sp.]